MKNEMNWKKMKRWQEEYKRLYLDLIEVNNEAYSENEQPVQTDDIAEINRHMNDLLNRHIKKEE